MHFRFLVSLVSLFLTLFYSSYSLSAIQLKADEIDSIEHFRAFTPSLQDKQKIPFIRHTAQDADGYIWMAGYNGLLRYNAYELTEFTLQSFSPPGFHGIPFIYLDQDHQFWAADHGLHKYDSYSETFTSKNVTNGQYIHELIDDGNNHLWLIGMGFGFLLYDKQNDRIDDVFRLSNFHNEGLDALSGQYDQEQKVLWMVTKQGVFQFNKNTLTLRKIDTPVDEQLAISYLRDSSLDTQRGHFWVPSPRGLVRIKTDTLEVTVFQPNSDDNSLPVFDVTTSYLDSGNNLWLGLEKEGLCLHRHQYEDFLCLASSIEDAEKIPFATVEDISEDDSGSLWLSVNSYGVVRLNPDLEKIYKLRNQFSNSPAEFFPNTSEGVVLENGDIWMATDGGGINIYNYYTKTLTNLKHDPNNEHSIPSNSVLSLTKDEHGFIWAGFWAGGMSRIDPSNMTFRHYRASKQPNIDNTLMGNNIFVIESDFNGGLWIAEWSNNGGVQFYDQETDTFTAYLYKDKHKQNNITNSSVDDIAFFDGKVWFAGSVGLETFDPETQQFTVLLEGEEYSLTSLFIDNLENIYLGSRRGLIRYNAMTKTTTRWTTEDGLSDNEIFFLRRDKNGVIWIATNNGITLFDEQENSFLRYYIQDGLDGNQHSSHGQFISVKDKIFVAGKSGVSIIDPDNLPEYTHQPRTILTNIESVSASGNEDERELDLSKQSQPRLSYRNNSLKFEFSALNFIFPERNVFRYRLVGWKNEFTEVSASERVVRYMNLSPGDYRFEVFGSNGSGVWDSRGAIYRFTILTPWYATWWAICLYIVLLLIALYVATKLRLAVVIKREQQLSAKVKQKTFELEQNALQLEQTSGSLAKLNTELEQRVERRTAELQVEVNERKVVESKLFHMAFHDPLTNLPNRQWLIQRLEKAIQSVKRHPQRRFCLMFLDGDRFKQINDTHGHSVGDRLLIAAAMRLSGLLKHNQQAARLGGDEFTVFIENISSLADMRALAAEIIEAFKMPFNLGSQNIHFHVSIGIVVCDSRYNAASSVLRDADIAMYRAKDLGKGTYKVFDSEMRTAIMSLAEIESDLHTAIEKEQFYLVYQPILNLKTDTLQGFEALIRWRHPYKGVVPPKKFITLAEENGLIWQIGAWALNEACRQMKIWHELDADIKPSISVNLSSGQLRNADFLSLVDEIITRHGIDSKYLKFELTETMLIENNETITKLIEDLHTRHIDLAIDDFGTGYSSLAYLNEIPVQYIKIDKKFIDAIDCSVIDCSLSGDGNHDALEIVKSTVSLGQSLRKQVVAEGIEGQQQLDALKRFGCDFAQGYFISMPLSVKDAQAMLLNPMLKQSIRDMVTTANEFSEGENS